MKPLFALLGPTACGKSSLALRIAAALPGRFEIVGCDSRQIYDEMVIGTAAPTLQERQEVAHHLVGFLSPLEKISAGRYATVALEAIDAILARGRLPLLVGGTGFYFRALCGGLFTSSVDAKLRADIEALSGEERLEELGRLDPEAIAAPGEVARAGRIHPNDHYRLGRALELAFSGAELWSQQWARRKEERLDGELDGELSSLWQIRGLILEVEQSSYFEQVALRARGMVETGLVEEALALRARYGADAAGLATIGYPQALACADGQIGQEELIEQLSILHRQYGKRQRTWFRRENRLERAKLPQKKGDFDRILQIFVD